MTSVLGRANERAKRSAYLVWIIGGVVYFFGVLHRSSLGVAGPDAVARLDISSAQLGIFVMIQLGVYAAMQVPAGIAIDRVGPRRVLLAATLLMGTAQITFAFATTYPVALAARAVLGVGDAAVFISCLRLVSEWFPRSRYAVLAMLTGLFGMAGNLAATVPLTWALGEYGWTRTFLLTGAVSVACSVLLLRPAVAAPFREEPPPGPSDAVARGWRGLVEDVRLAWRGTELGRGTQVGFWTHQATMGTATVLSMVWGFPFLTEALGYTADEAAIELSIMVIGILAFSLVIGPVTGRWPGWRMPIAIAVSLAGIVGWLLLIFWPGGPPDGIVTLAILLLAMGGPGSQVAFHLARDYNPRMRISTATGLVNVGGFSAAMLGAVLVGVILDARTGEATPELVDYRWALASLLGIAIFSTTAMIVSLLRLRRVALTRIESGEPVALPVVAHWWDGIR